MIATYIVPAANVPAARAVIARAAKKAAAAGIPVAVVTEGPMHRRVTETGQERYEVPFTLDGGGIVGMGWGFIARVDHIDGEWFCRTMPGATMPKEYRGRCVCDHCGTKRNRRTTYILRAPAAGCERTGCAPGATRQVGSACLAEYVTDQVAAEIVALVALLAALEALAFDGAYSEEGGQGGGGGYGCNPAEVVAISAALFELDGGYRSRSAFEGGCHAISVGDQLFSRNLSDAERLRPTAAQRADAAAAIAWAAALPESESEYMNNLRSLGALALEVECWPTDLLGLGVSLYGTYRRERAQAELEAALARSGSPLALAASLPAMRLPVDKVDGLHVIVTRITPYKSKYGGGVVITMRALSADGLGRHELVWFASDVPAGWTAGAEKQIAAKVKDLRPDQKTGEPTAIVGNVREVKPKKARRAS